MLIILQLELQILQLELIKILIINEFFKNIRYTKKLLSN